MSDGMAKVISDRELFVYVYDYLYDFMNLRTAGC